LAEAPRPLDEPGRPTLHAFSASDGYQWLYRKFDPPGEPIGRIVFIHGIQSHGGWYPSSCAQIAAAGYQVYFLDRRGCGLNQQTRGDMPQFRRALDDIAEFLRSLPADGKPRFLAAISWGGKLGVALQYRHPGLVDGLALLCPGIVPKVRPSFFARMHITFARVVRPSRFFPIPLNDPALFTASPQWQRFVEQDQLGLRLATSRMLFGNFGLNIYLRRAAKWVKLPVLLLLAEHDDIIDNAGVRAYVEKLPSVDKQIIEYPGAHHTLEFEPEGHPFVEDLVGWFNRRLMSVSVPGAAETPRWSGNSAAARRET
jgi:alpha-beta hydrolase superfamily lysophospholipase